jgi:DNA-binding NtrC family response regulator
VTTNPAIRQTVIKTSKQGVRAVNSILFVAPPALPHRPRYVSRIREAGFLPVSVEDVEAALRLLKEFSVAVVILHLRTMTSTHWEEFGRLIGTQTAVIVTSDDSTEEVIRKHVAAGCAAFITERFTPTALAAVVKRTGAGERGIELTSRRTPAAV